MYSMDFTMKTVCWIVLTNKSFKVTKLTEYCLTSVKIRIHVYLKLNSFAWDCPENILNEEYLHYFWHINIQKMIMHFNHKYAAFNYRRGQVVYIHSDLQALKFLVTTIGCIISGWWQNFYYKI